MSAVTSSDFRQISSMDGLAQFAGRVVAYKTTEKASEDYTIEDTHFGYLYKSYRWLGGSQMSMSTLMKIQKVATASLSEAAKENHPPLDMDDLQNSSLWRRSGVVTNQSLAKSSFEFKPGMPMRLATRQEVHLIRRAIWNDQASFTDEYCDKEKINRIFDDHIVKLVGCG